MYQQQKKKKKQPKNAFYFFMMHFKIEQERKGIKFPGGIKDVSEKAAPIWKTMRPEERWKFEEEAKQEKEKDKTNLENKFTTQGKSYAQLEREKNELLEQRSRMRHEIQSTISSLDPSTTLATYPFHIIHVNFYCKQENGVYTPCEIAVCEFNFSEGITRTYHTLINPGEIPLGYKYEAVKLSSDTHNIPVPPDEFDGETDYYKIFTNIKRFVMGMKDKDLYPYYTLPNSIDAVNSVLDKLQEDFSEKIEFRVYPLPYLFYCLRNCCVTLPGVEGFPVMSIAEREFDRDVFNFTKGISCDFHEKSEAFPHCSLSCVKRWSFSIMDFCCQDLGIELIPGQHCPKQASTSHCQMLSPANQKSIDKSKASNVMTSPRAERPVNETKSLAPLRRPKTQSEALMFSREDFPAIGASKNESCTSPGVKSPSKESKSLEPLRLPKTLPEAFRVCNESFSEDFPAFDATENRSFGTRPVGVGGRGRGLSYRAKSNYSGETEPIASSGHGRTTFKLDNPVAFGRGRSLLQDVEDDVKNLNVK